MMMELIPHAFVQVKLTQEELAAIIEQTGGALKDMKMEEEDDKPAGEDDDDDEDYEDLGDVEEEAPATASSPTKQDSKEDEDVVKEFKLENYDEEGNSIMFCCNLGP